MAHEPNKLMSTSISNIKEEMEQLRKARTKLN